MPDRHVIDAHAHFSFDRRAWFGEFMLAHPELDAAINLWDLEPTEGRSSTSALRPWEPAPDGMILFHHPDLTGLGSNERESAAVADLRAAWANGARGIKVWKDLGLWIRDDEGARVAVDDRRLDWLWSGAAEARAPIAIHVADAPAFFEPLDDANERIAELRLKPHYWFGDSGRFPSLEQIHDEFESLIARHPDTTFIAVHFGVFLPYERLHRMLSAYPNLNVDTAAMVSDLGRPRDRDAVLAIFRDFPDRIIFGTDLIRAAALSDLPPGTEFDSYLVDYYDSHYRFFETDDEQDLLLPEQGNWRTKGLALPSENLQLLYAGNIRRLLGSAPE